MDTLSYLNKILVTANVGYVVGFFFLFSVVVSFSGGAREAS